MWPSAHGATQRLMLVFCDSLVQILGLGSSEVLHMWHVTLVSGPMEEHVM